MHNCCHYCRMIDIREGGGWRCHHHLGFVKALFLQRDVIRWTSFLFEEAVCYSSSQYPNHLANHNFAYFIQDFTAIRLPQNWSYSTCIYPHCSLALIWVLLLKVYCLFIWLGNRILCLTAWLIEPIFYLGILEFASVV